MALSLLVIFSSSDVCGIGLLETAFDTGLVELEPDRVVFDAGLVVWARAVVEISRAPRSTLSMAIHKVE
jgi:hypothetical protein